MLWNLRERWRRWRIQHHADALADILWPGQGYQIRVEYEQAQIARFSLAPMEENKADGI